MADEQIRLLQEILAAVKEQTAVNKQYRDDAMALQQTALDRQRTAIKNQRVAILIVLAMVGLLIYFVSR